jgi:FtsP/CotA-like multicopper oxidase with cupredoxin domain
MSHTTRAYHLNGVGSVPGPTLRVKPGDVLSLTLTNNLEDTGADMPDHYNDNTFHSKTLPLVHWLARHHLAALSIYLLRLPTPPAPSFPFKETDTHLASFGLTGPNTTSLHIYGARLDPLVNDRFRRIPPGNGSYTYVYTIPLDHLPGLFWCVRQKLNIMRYRSRMTQGNREAGSTIEHASHTVCMSTVCMSEAWSRMMWV